MEGMEQAIQSVLDNPEMMEKIMGMAQAFGGSPSNTSGEADSAEAPGESPIPDLSGMAQLGSLLGQANIDSDQQNLLKALSPYMSSPHISKLKRAMQAARLAELAGSVMGTGLFNMGGDHV